MRKKKGTVLKKAITSPVSIPKFIGFSLIAIGILAINISSFRSLSPTLQPQSNPPPLLTQSDLMNVLGTTISLGDTPQITDTDLQDNPQAVYWYSVLKDKPYFRDAHLILATIAYNAHHCDLAQTHLANALAIDPNISGISSLQEAIIGCKR